MTTDSHDDQGRSQPAALGCNEGLGLVGDSTVLDCWRANYGLDKTPHELHSFWQHCTPPGAVLALKAAVSEIERLREELRQKHAEYEDLKRCAANNTRNQGLKIETLLRGINDARALIDPIWRHRMGAEQVREHVQRGLRCIDSAITDCQFTAPTAVHASDCAMHNAPAYPAGECDCGALWPND